MSDRTTKIRKALALEGEIRRDIDTPIYRQIRDRLARLIRDDVLPVGAKVPSERDLAEWFGVSRTTARLALDSMANDCTVHRRGGRAGTSVSARVSHDLANLRGFTDMIRGHGHEVQTHVLSVVTCAAPGHVAKALGLPDGEAVHRIQRLRSIGGEPSTIEDSTVPAARFPGLLAHDLNGSIYEIFERHYAQRPMRSSERISAAAATKSQSELLDVASGTPLLKVERVAYGADGNALEYSVDVHRSDQIEFIIHGTALAGRSGG